MSQNAKTEVDENLAQAVLDHDVDCAARLLDKGADVNARASSSQLTSRPTVLMLAARYGQKEIVLRLLDGGADANATDDDHGATPLSWASEQGHVDIVVALLEAGADVNAVGTGGQTPLMMACIYGQSEVVKILLDHSANTDLRERYEVGTRPLSDMHLYNAEELAARQGHDDIVQLLRQHPRKGWPSWLLCYCVACIAFYLLAWKTLGLSRFWSVLFSLPFSGSLTLGGSYVIKVLACPRKIRHAVSAGKNLAAIRFLVEEAHGGLSPDSAIDVACIEGFYAAVLAFAPLSILAFVTLGMLIPTLLWRVTLALMLGTLSAVLLSLLGTAAIRTMIRTMARTMKQEDPQMWNKLSEIWERRRRDEEEQRKR